MQIAQIQQALVRDNWVFVSGAQLWRLLNQFSCCSAEDIESLHALWDHSLPQCDERGRVVYPYKGTLVSYYQMQAAESPADTGGSIRRSSSHNWRDGRAIEHIDPTTVGAASHFRAHKQWPDTADNHLLLKALQTLIFKILTDESELDWHADTDRSEPAAFETMMSAFRVNKTVADGTNKLQNAEPGPEGVHQDSADLTAIVLMDRTNVAAASAGNRLWSLEQPAGKPMPEDLQPESGRLIASPMLLHRFDTLLVLDRKVKHEALPIQIAGGLPFARRDVLTFEARRPNQACATSKL